MVKQYLGALLPLLGLTNAHGGVYNYTINGVAYDGHYPFWLEDQQPESIQRRWWPDPIQALDHPYMACNRGNPLATRNPSLHAPVTAGTNITVVYVPPACPDNIFQPTEPFPWKNESSTPFRCHGPEYSWVHGLGPMFVYLADCGGPCQDFHPEGKKVWFKIYETEFHPGNETWGGRRDIASSSAWDQSNYANKGWSVQIPKWLKPGHYLIRHEIIMIELMPPQLYPECAQLIVEGDGDAVPPEDFLVSFPGAYSYDEPGLAIAGQVYRGDVGHVTFNYTTPGPKVWTGANE